MSIPVKAGNALPLKLLAKNKSTDRVVTCDLRNAKDDSVLSSGISLTHVADGLYSNTSTTMPNALQVLAIYSVFENNGTDPSLSTEKVTTDLFVLDTRSQDASLKMVVKNNEKLNMRIKNNEKLRMTIKIETTSIPVLRLTIKNNEKLNLRIKNNEKLKLTLKE